MMTLAVVAEIVVVVAVVLCAPSLYRKVTVRRGPRPSTEPPCPRCGHRAHPETPMECEWCPEGYCETPQPAGAFRYDNGVTTGEREP